MVKSTLHKMKPAKTAKEAKEAKKEAAPKQKKQKGYIRRAIKRAEPKIIENPKAAMFIRTTTASQYIMNVMRDLVCTSCQKFILLAASQEAQRQAIDEEERYSSLRGHQLSRVLQQEERLQSVYGGKPLQEETPESHPRPLLQLPAS